MMEMFATALLIISLVVLFWYLILYVYERYKHNTFLSAVFATEDDIILNDNFSAKKAEFKLKLQRAGLKKKQFNEIVFASVLAGASLISLLFFMDFSFLNKFFLVAGGLSIAFFMPYLYLEEQIKARIKRIENDLPIFIDLLIIILEGGGGLNNAIDKVTTEGESVLGPDLLAESKKFKNEFITYSSDIAFTNLVNRTGSDAIATIVGFMRLSEETGIGVKSIFENQAQELKSMEMLNIEKKAATMNIGITFVMFLFILPAVIAMIAFPMAADALMPGF
ncbi:type II secretion system F family protein [Sulfurimonas sp. SWIR-19]|uniref:type II secretion system F family protein n=1 Tax=Sulfurimonas sp. SWIR-19 TaxID=2878390 RepID=UPI001CF4396A|nr:type II secretion system F family protein [Sulfurimonas sp. SWIR-19]UCM99935.1 type II secretion system F family protein [Sulfurimonas sp. SWIR-19]